MVCFHDLAVEIQISALLVVLAMVGCLLTLKGFWRFGLDSHRIEFLWTVIPFVIIIFFAVPSLVSLYLMASSPSYIGAGLEKSQLRSDRVALTKVFFEFFHTYNPRYEEGSSFFSRLKERRRVPVLVTGRQWYWDYGTVTKVGSNGVLSGLVSSHIVSTNDVFHLLQLDQWLYLSLGEGYVFSVTSGDVLHSFAIPTLGIKIDAVPGKDNSIYCSPIIPGLFFGNCSEICGVNHSVMPIGIVVDRAKLRGNRPELWTIFSASVDFLKESLIKALKCVRFSLIVNQMLYFSA